MTPGQIFYPPKATSSAYIIEYRIFLAGSIEMGKASDWQQRVADIITSEVDEYEYPRHIFFNPRRKDWDSSWKQGIEEPQFYQQVNWELENLAGATHIIMYFEPGTMSPISLLELGLYAESGKLLVVCPEGYWRKGNVDVVCDKYGIPTFDTIQEAALHLAAVINSTE